jgi:FkbM family methyltransferase
MGFVPKVIYDIGAYRGGWSKAASEVFPAAEFVMFDANADNESHLAATGRRYLIAALSSEDVAEKPLFLPQTGDSTGTSLYVENTSHYAKENLQVRTVPTMRLDSIVAKQRLPRPDLVKLDVQGAELDVMKGAMDALSTCNAMILETSFVTYNKSAPLIADVLAALDRAEWKCVDICELHRTKGDVALQVDLLFVKPALFEKFCAAAGIL